MIGSIIKYIIGAALMAGLMACSGTQEELDLTIVTSTDSFPADGKSKVTVSVFEGKADVTSNSVIYEKESGRVIDGGVFSTTESGEYFFYAEYNGRTTDYVKVTAEQVVESQFVRNICLMEFTDASCSFCPDASRYIDRIILSKNENVHLMSFHEKDQWRSEQFAVLFEKFSLSATPSASVDMRSGDGLDSGKRDWVKNSVSESQTAYPAHCGVAVSSQVVQGVVNVDVKLYSELSSEYYIAVYVVEDGLIGYQLDGSLGSDNYYHQFVVRMMLSETVYGDSMGKVNAGSEKSAEYDFECNTEWNLEKTYIYALAIDSDGFVNNMQVCLLDGGNTDYEYINNI